MRLRLRLFLRRLKADWRLIGLTLTRQLVSERCGKQACKLVADLAVHPYLSERFFISAHVRIKQERLVLLDPTDKEYRFGTDTRLFSFKSSSAVLTYLRRRLVDSLEIAPTTAVPFGAFGVKTQACTF